MHNMLQKYFNSIEFLSYIFIFIFAILWRSAVAMYLRSNVSAITSRKSKIIENARFLTVGTSVEYLTAVPVLKI